MLFGIPSAVQRGARLFRGRERTSAGGWISRDEAIMGTAIRVELWSDDRTAGVLAIDAVMEEMHRIDHAMSPFKPASELSRINRDAAAAAVPVSEEMFRLLERALELSELSDGAFDITYASAGHLYDYREGVKPTDQALAQACAAIGWRHLILDRAARTVRFARAGMRIDLGGFAKGHAVDNGA
ncbi:MAG: FAD:protein FMN transferase, partial [Rhizobacter sp.]